LSAGALPQTPLGELIQRSSRPPSWFRGGPPGKGKEGCEGEMKRRRDERRGRKGEGEERGGDERESWTPQIFRWIDAFAVLACNV